MEISLNDAQPENNPTDVSYGMYVQHRYGISEKNCVFEVLSQSGAAFPRQLGTALASEARVPAIRTGTFPLFADRRILLYWLCDQQLSRQAWCSASWPGL